VVFEVAGESKVRLLARIETMGRVAGEEFRNGG
jgi:hypothetical protein